MAEWIAKRQTAEGHSVYLWPDGALTWALGQYIKGSPHPKTSEQKEAALAAGWLVLGSVELYDDDEVPALIEAARWAAEHDRTPGAMRKRFHERETAATIKPVWTTIETDRDGNPKVQVWKLPRIAWPGLAVWREAGTYSVLRKIPGSTDSYSDTGFKCRNLKELEAILAKLRT